MSLANFLRVRNGNKQLDFENLERVDVKTLECDKLVLNGQIFTKEHLEAGSSYASIVENENELKVTKTIDATGFNLVGSNLVGTLMTGNQPEILNLPNLNSIGNATSTVSVNHTLNVAGDITSPLFDVSGTTGAVNVGGTLTSGAIVSPTIDFLLNKITYLTTKLNKLLEYIEIDETDADHPVIRLKKDSSLHLTGELTQG